jgi:hypothetical protein
MTFGHSIFTGYMMTDQKIPPFLSLEFHKVFFPRLLRHRLSRQQSRERGVAFTSTMEMMIVLALCVVFAIVGLPAVVGQGSLIGWIIAGIGFAGILTLTILSITANLGNPPSFDYFLTGTFFFFVAIGAFIGIPSGMSTHHVWLGIAVSIGGLAAGYMAGIAAGLWLQYLGWIAGIINSLAILGAVIVAGTALVLGFLPLMA